MVRAIMVTLFCSEWKRAQSSSDTEICKYKINEQVEISKWKQKSVSTSKANIGKRRDFLTEFWGILSENFANFNLGSQFSGFGVF